MGQVRKMHVDISGLRLHACNLLLLVQIEQLIEPSGPDFLSWGPQELLRQVPEVDRHLYESIVLSN